MFTSRKLSHLQISNNYNFTSNDVYEDDDDDDSDGDNKVIVSFDHFSCLVTFLFVTRRMNEENWSYLGS
jgi:hypothetical protein